MPSFVTAFTPPAPPSGFVIESDLPASAVHLAWDPSDVPQVDFGGFRVYRSEDGGLSWTLLTVLATTTDTEYDDFEAPLNVSLIYRLTQSNLDFESDAEEGGALLESLAWWVVTPGDASLTFPITRQTGANLTSPKVDEVFSPIGRPTKVAVGDVVQTEGGTLSWRVMPDDTQSIRLWKTAQARMDAPLIMKSTDGTVHRVLFGNISRSFERSGMQNLNVSFDGVS